MLRRVLIVDKEVAVESAEVEDEYVKVKAMASLDCKASGEQCGARNMARVMREQP